MGNQAVNPYDYSHRIGVHPISWEDFHRLCKGLVAAVAAYRPEIILPVGRGGFYPGTLIAHLLQAEVYPVRLSRRVNDIVTYERPRWLVEPPEAVKDRRVLIVDEISSTGETIRMVKDKVTAMGAHAVRSAVLVAHSWGVAVPDYIGLVSDALILNPWDREIWKDGDFQFNPEYVEALEKQGLVAGEGYLIGASAIKIAKS